VAIDVATGAARWRSECRTRGYLAADRSRVFCLAASRARSLALVALNAATGEELWRHSHGLSRGLRAPTRPVPLRGDRVCWTTNDSVDLLDARTGGAIWTRSIANEGSLSCAAVRGDHIYIVSGKALHCLEAASGEQSWRVALDEQAIGHGRPLVALDGERIYFTQTPPGRDAQAFCMDLATRHAVWKRAIPGARCLLAASGTVYVRGQRILALDGLTGQTLWDRPASGCGPLTCVDGRIHFVDSSAQGRLIALDQRTGRKAWEIAGVRSCDAFTKVGTTAYIKTGDGVVHALALHSGGRS
jgi:outer membrane protein assembly factor BamB